MSVCRCVREHACLCRCVREQVCVCVCVCVYVYCVRQTRISLTLTALIVGIFSAFFISSYRVDSPDEPHE